MDFFNVAKYNFLGWLHDGFHKPYDQVENFFGGASAGREDGNFFAHHRRCKGRAKLRDRVCFAKATRGDDHDLGPELLHVHFFEQVRLHTLVLCSVNDAQTRANEAVVEFDLVVRPRVLEGVNFI